MGQNSAFQDKPLHLVAGSCVCADNSSVLTELLMQHGADIHARNRFADTPAHLATSSADVETMQLLIAAGINFRARGFRSETILHRALVNWNGMLEYLLRQEGGKKIIHVQDNFGETRLDHAVRLGARDAVERLLECGANT